MSFSPSTTLNHQLLFLAVDLRNKQKKRACNTIMLVYLYYSFVRLVAAEMLGHKRLRASYYYISMQVRIVHTCYTYYYLDRRLRDFWSTNFRNRVWVTSWIMCVYFRHLAIKIIIILARLVLIWRFLPDFCKQLF